MRCPTFDQEKRLVSDGFLPVGVDEAGRGPLAGPVVAAAVCLNQAVIEILHSTHGREYMRDLESEWKMVRDSKKLSPKQREKAFEFIHEQFHVGVGIIGPETIDRINILQATFLAMKAAIASLKQQLSVNTKQGNAEEKLALLIDGNQLLPNYSGKQEAIVNGDALVRSIAAASIVAKVTRDRLIVEADKLYPGYGLAQHKGYGTKEHMIALRRLGPSPIHRMSFDPVKLSIPENVNRKLATLVKKRKSW